MNEAEVQERLDKVGLGRPHVLVTGVTQEVMTPEQWKHLFFKPPPDEERLKHVQVRVEYVWDGISGAHIGRLRNSDLITTATEDLCGWIRSQRAQAEAIRRWQKECDAKEEQG